MANEAWSRPLTSVMTVSVIFSHILLFGLAGGNQSKTLVRSVHVSSQKSGSHSIKTTDVN